MFGLELTEIDLGTWACTNVAVRQMSSGIRSLCMRKDLQWLMDMSAWECNAKRCIAAVICCFSGEF